MPCQYGRHSPQFGNKRRDECDVWARKISMQNISRFTQELQKQVGHDRCPVNLSRYVKTFNGQAVNFTRSSFERLITTHHGNFMPTTSKILCKIVDIRFGSSPPWWIEAIYDDYPQDIDPHDVPVVVVSNVVKSAYERNSSRSHPSQVIGISPIASEDYVKDKRAREMRFWSVRTSASNDRIMRLHD